MSRQSHWIQNEVYFHAKTQHRYMFTGVVMLRDGSHSYVFCATENEAFWKGGAGGTVSTRDPGDVFVKRL